MFPRLFHIGSFSVPTYGFLVALGVLVGMWVSVRYAQKQGIDPDDAWNFGIVVVLCGLLVREILYIVNDWSIYAANPRQIFTLDTLQAGGVFYGGLLAAFIGTAWYIHKRRMPALATCDAFAPGLALGHVFGRMGCFSAGCCFRKTDDPLLGRRYSPTRSPTPFQTPL